MSVTILRVSQLNRFVKSFLEGEDRLRDLYLSGEIANFKAYPSGHFYFSLRDESASVAAVMFRGNAQNLRFLPENGMQVLARGSVTLYERDGKFQVVVSELIPKGEGERAVALLQLRRRLEAEGLFAQERKRTLPPRPRVIGVVTSEKGAVLHDIISVVTRKSPQTLLLLSPAAVQGAQAAASIAKAVRALNADGRAEVILVARGGGSAEDLWSFQDEGVARAVAGSAIPVVSAVGHETDVTLCDLAADLRAATPTAAAEIALGGIADLPEQLRQREEALGLYARRALAAAEEKLIPRRAALLTACGRKLQESEGQLSARREKIFSISPAAMLAAKEEKLYNIERSLHNSVEKFIAGKEKLLSDRARSLELVSPVKVLARGYSVTQKDGRALRSAGELRPGDTVFTLLNEGSLTSVVTEVTI